MNTSLLHRLQPGEQLVAAKTPTREGYYADPQTLGAIKQRADELHEQLSRLTSSLLWYQTQADMTRQFVAKMTGESNLDATTMLAPVAY